MLRLGNIDYSNCYPIHGPVLEEDRPPWLRVVDGPPSELNRRLAAAELDIAPGSSIELARHDREYGALDGLCIGSDGPVDSIVLATRVPLRDLEGRSVALPTASATSRCLVRILLELRLGVRPEWVDFDQSVSDPLAAPPVDDRSGGPSRAADAALFIGDVALRRPPRPGEIRYDLGREWTEWTGLPFVYAVWMVRNEAADRDELRLLHRLLLARRDDLPGAFSRLAVPGGLRYGFTPDRLVHYWSHIRYRLDASMLDGLQHFLRLASELGEAPPAPDVRLLS
jgi:chorismate dehydratase